MIDMQQLFFFFVGKHCLDFHIRAVAGDADLIEIGVERFAQT